MELLREEVHAEIAMLAGLSRCGDANHLAGTALEHQEVTNTDVVARDGDSLRSASTSLDITNIFRHSFTDAVGWTTLALLFLDDYLLALVLRCEGVENAVSCFLKAVAERMIMALVVVISHSWFAFFFENYFGFYSLFSRVMMRSTLKFNVVSWINASAVVTLSDIDLFLTVGNLDVDVGTTFYVDVGTAVYVDVGTAVCVVVAT